jgi:tRNA dimethylallyltransferase
MNRLIVILGPTATGKSELGMLLARKLNTEIVSGDSMYVYRRMNIGTAKPKPDELRDVRHHLIDIREPDETFSVADFQRLATEAITAVNQKGKIPILVGGTGLYLQALLEGYRFSPSASVPEIRRRLKGLSEQPDGKKLLYNLLCEKSPEAAATLHPNDTKRIIRAIELWETNKDIVSQSNKVSSTPDLLFDCLVYGLDMDRYCLYDRIDSRFDAMMAEGLLNEVDELVQSGVSENATSFQAIGYGELAAYRKGCLSLHEATVLSKVASRRFAKRQKTWFRRMPYIKWLNVDPDIGVAPLVPLIMQEVAEKYSIG